jgi:hypothetical protein
VAGFPAHYDCRMKVLLAELPGGCSGLSMSQKGLTNAVWKRSQGTMTGLGQKDC